MGHTPGPWYANGDCVEADGPEGPRDITLAVVTGTRAGHEVAADARLIAAAPSLLLCLRAALAAFTELDDGWREMDATLVDQIIATNRYAIEGCLLLAEGTDEQTGRVD